MRDKKRKSENSINYKEIREDYLRLLEASFQQTAEINKGDVFEGSISNITDQYIIVNLAGKYDAYADINEFCDENGNLNYKIGDTLKGFIIDKNDQGFIIGKSLTKQFVDKGAIKDAFEKKIPVKGKVYGLIKGGFSVDVLGAKAFCPTSQIGIKLLDDAAQYIGRNMDFEVIECSDNCRHIVVSHRVLEEKEAEERKTKAMQNIYVDAQLKGKVMRLTRFGAFVDLGGIEGLLHVSEISWHHVAKPQDALKEGQEIEVKVLKIEGDKISLSMKALEENPFQIAIKKLKEGDIINCRVLRLHNFGAFVELSTGVEGLIPVSEMSRTRMINRPDEILKEGDFVEAQIIRIDEEKQKISLSLKALQKDPWDEVDEELSVGQEFTGIVENSTNFGVFVTIKEGFTGLLPRSRVRKQDVFKAGDEVTLIISAIDKDQKRITLDYINSLDEPTETKEEKRSIVKKSYDKADKKTKRLKDKDPDWKRYASQKTNPADDNPFKDL